MGRIAVFSAFVFVIALAAMNVRGAHGSPRPEKFESDVRLPKMSGLAAVSAPPSGFYDLQAQDIDGDTMSMDKFTGKVLLITNVATY